MKPRLRTVSGYVALWPTRAPSVCDAGVSSAAWAGAIFVIAGDPVVDGPSAERAAYPSLTIVATLCFSRESIRTVSFTCLLSPAGIVKARHVTVPREYVPPSLAPAKLVSSGTGSVICTPVAAALPMLRNVSV